jgi:hypothetical protein
MACGTGKTFTALKIAEKLAPDNGLVLFLVPSISLLSQTLREWTDVSTLFRFGFTAQLGLLHKATNAPPTHGFALFFQDLFQAACTINRTVLRVVLVMTAVSSLSCAAFLLSLAAAHA